MMPTNLSPQLRNLERRRLFHKEAIRYERLERNYMAMLNIAVLTLWLK